MKHLLVIRLSALGDAAILAPVVRAYAAANPDVRFTVAAPPLLEPLFNEMTPNVDFLGVNKKQNSRAIYRQLKAVGADSVADMHRVNKVNRALTLLWLDETLHLHLRFRIRHLHKGRISRLLMINHIRKSARRPQYLRYSDVFRRFGLNETKLSLPASQPPSYPTIGIAPFAQHKGKVWPFEYTCKLALMLAEEGVQVLLFGSRDEAQQLESLATQNNNITSLAGKLSFKEELDALRQLTLMVSMDSANMHFASAAGIPVVSIWGATHPTLGFYGFGQDPANAISAHLSCQPCSVYGKGRCRFGDYRCLHAVKPEQVLEHIHQILRPTT